MPTITTRSRLRACAVTRTSGLALWMGGRSGAGAPPDASPVSAAAEAAPEVPSVPLRRADADTPRASLDPNGLPPAPPAERPASAFQAAAAAAAPGSPLGSPLSPPGRSPRKAQPPEVLEAAQALLANGAPAARGAPAAPRASAHRKPGDPTPATPAGSRAASLLQPPPQLPPPPSAAPAGSRAASLLQPPPPLPPPPGFVAAALGGGGAGGAAGGAAGQQRASAAPAAGAVAAGEASATPRQERHATKGVSGGGEGPAGGSGARASAEAVDSPRGVARWSSEARGSGDSGAGGARGAAASLARRWLPGVRTKPGGASCGSCAPTPGRRRREDLMWQCAAWTPSHGIKNKSNGSNLMRCCACRCMAALVGR